MRTVPFIFASVFTTVCVATAAAPIEAGCGAFTFVQGSNRLQCGWNHFIISQLPKFVRNLDHAQSPALPVATTEDGKPPHIVEKPDMKGRMASGLPCRATEDGAVVVKSFFARMSTYPDIRFREFIDPRYLKKHGLADRDIAFEIADHQGIESLQVADDKQTVLVVLGGNGGREAFIMRCTVYEGHIYISPENAPDSKTGIFKPWILRTKLIERK